MTVGQGMLAWVFLEDQPDKWEDSSSSSGVDLRSDPWHTLLQLGGKDNFQGSLVRASRESVPCDTDLGCRHI